MNDLKIEKGIIRKAQRRDLEDINRLLSQVLDVHHKGRPDIFKGDVKKYSDDELLSIIDDFERPIFVFEESEKVFGYVFCVIQRYIDNNILTDIKTLYIDDLCVDGRFRGKGIGTLLYDYAVAYAKQIGCYNVTLNVWSCNHDAMEFYKKRGLIPQKVCMETVL